MTDLYCVLHKDPGYSREAAAAFLAGERRIELPEAAAAVRKSPGFLLENASLDKSSAFNLQASAYGFETVLLSHKDLKRPSPALTVSKIELKTEGFYYVSDSVKEHVSFEAVRMLTACAFDIEVPPRNGLAVMEAGLIDSLRARYFPFAFPGFPAAQPPDIKKPPAAPAQAPASPALLAPEQKSTTPLLHRSAPAKGQKGGARETVFFADIFLGSPAPVRLHVPCDGQDYSGIGPKKALSSLENFRILLDELSALAFGAHRNIFLEALLNKEPLGPLKYPSREAYEKELVWLHTIHAIG